MEYRPFPDERVDEFRAFMRYAFSPAGGPYDPDEEDGHETIADRRGLFDGEDPVAVCAHHDFSLRIRGADRAVAGLSAVASPPEHRRRGNVGRMLGESLAEHRERDVDVSVLWPFEYSFYARYGWATASRYRRFTVPPEQLGFVDDLIATEGNDADGGAGTFRRLGEDDYPAVRPVFDAMANRYALTMDRTEEWWRERTLRGWKADPFVYGWERDGELRAICAYTFGDANDGDDTVLRVSDAAFVDDEAWFQLLRFFRNHDSQVAEVVLDAPPDAPLPDLVEDPRAATCEVRTGPMVRLVDVAGAFEALDPDPAVDATFSIAVEDPLAEWNDVAFRLDVADGSVAVESAPSAAPVDLAVDVGTLSQVYVGYRSVEEAVRSGGLARGTEGPARDAATPDALRALCPPQTTHLRERF